jgi:GNAT superfamily N-acetyltransferase
MQHWHAEPSPTRFDAQKKAFFARLTPGTVRVDPAGDFLPGSWWRLEVDGELAGYGWMDVTWGDAQILLAVDPDLRGKGYGKAILEHLEFEAHREGLGYLFNTIPADHPDPDAVRGFLEANGFARSGLDGRLLRRKVGASD